MCGKQWPVIHTFCYYIKTSIFVALFFIPVRFSHHYKWINPWRALTKKDGDVFILFFKSVRLIAAIRTSWKVFLIRWIFHFLKWKLVFIFHMLSCWSAQMKMVLKTYKRAGFTLLLRLSFCLLKMHYAGNADHYPLCYLFPSLTSVKSDIE